MKNKSWDNLLSCHEINKLDIVDFLSSIGYLPGKIRGNNYWYHSPFRNERTASFKVNRKLNRWKDFGTGEGKTLIDFGIKYFDCTIRELLLRLSANEMSNGLVALSASNNTTAYENPLIIIENRTINSPALFHYLRQRRIQLNVAQKYCMEATYEVNKRRYYAISFKNNSGGFELRNKYFKGSNSPKDITLIELEHKKTLFVFEGFFDFLSCFSIFRELKDTPDFLILNSISFFKKGISIMLQYPQVNLFLDNDINGKQCAKYALTTSKNFFDMSFLYSGCKDLNDFLCGRSKQFVL